MNENYHLPQQEDRMVAKLSLERPKVTNEGVTINNINHEKPDYQDIIYYAVRAVKETTKQLGRIGSGDEENL